MCEKHNLSTLLNRADAPALLLSRPRSPALIPCIHLLRRTWPPCALPLAPPQATTKQPPAVPAASLFARSPPRKIPLVRPFTQLEPPKGKGRREVCGIYGQQTDRDRYHPPLPPPGLATGHPATLPSLFPASEPARNVWSPFPGIFIESAFGRKENKAGAIPQWDSSFHTAAGRRVVKTMCDTAVENKQILSQPLSNNPCACLPLAPLLSLSSLRIPSQLARTLGGTVGRTRPEGSSPTRASWH